MATDYSNFPWVNDHWGLLSLRGNIANLSLTESAHEQAVFKLSYGAVWLYRGMKAQLKVHGGVCPGASELRNEFRTAGCGCEILNDERHQNEWWCVLLVLICDLRLLHSAGQRGFGCEILVPSTSLSFFTADFVTEQERCQGLWSEADWDWHWDQWGISPWSILPSDRTQWWGCPLNVCLQHPWNLASQAWCEYEASRCCVNQSWKHAQCHYWRWD